MSSVKVDKLLVSKIEKGIVIDHIAPCKGMMLLNILNPDADARVVIAKNVASSKYGRKDLLKIEGEYLTSAQIDIIALISPTATVNIIDGWEVKEKRRVSPPSELVGIIDCRNPLCISRTTQSRFSISLREPIEHSYFECSSCGYRLFYNDVIEEIVKKASAGILISKDKVRRELLNLLLAKGGLRLYQRFKLKSGRLSPYFINLGALNDGESLARLRWILASFVKILLNEGVIGDFDFIFGPAYKGINLAALTCEGLSEYFGLNRRYIYDRKEEKSYGDRSMDRQIVGAEYFRPGQRVIIVDDTITTGQTKLDSIAKLSSLGEHQISGVIVCVDRQETTDGEISAVDYLKSNLGVKVYSILNAETIYAMIKDGLSPEERSAWIDYYEKYGVVKLK